MNRTWAAAAPPSPELPIIVPESEPILRPRADRPIRRGRSRGARPPAGGFTSRRRRRRAPAIRHGGRARRSRRRRERGSRPHRRWSRLTRGMRFAEDSPPEQRGFELLVPRVAEERWRTDKLRSCVMAVVGAGPPMSAPFTVGLVVRIPFAPAASLQTFGPGRLSLTSF
jgi:hypothetical protein